MVCMYSDHNLGLSLRETFVFNIRLERDYSLKWMDEVMFVTPLCVVEVVDF